MLAAIFLLGRSAEATDQQWTGTSTTTWSTGGNWSGLTAPLSTDNALFDTSFSRQANLTADATVGGIWMTTGVQQNVTISLSGGTALTLNGNTINGTAGLGILMDNSSAFALTITAPVRLGNAQTWANQSGNLLTVGAVNLNTKALTIDGTGNTAATGVMSGSGALTKNGSGTLTLTGTNTYVGTNTFNGGTVAISKAAALGNASNTVTLNAATLEATLTFATSRVFTLGDAASTIMVDPAKTFTISSAIGGTGALTKTGTGTLLLSGTNTFSGGTTVSAGTLSLTGSLASGATVGSSGTLTGTGTVNGAVTNAGALTVTAGAFTLAGTSSDLNNSGTVSVSNSTLNVNGDVANTAPSASFPTAR